MDIENVHYYTKHDKHLLSAFHYEGIKRPICGALNFDGTHDVLLIGNLRP